MSLLVILINVLFGLLAFFLVRYIASMVVPAGANKDNIITIIAIIVGVVVFFANLASQLGIVK